MEIAEMIKCPTCKSAFEQQPDKCGNCGYPFSGTPDERAHFVAHHILKKGKLSDTKDSIKQARIILFIIAGFNIIVPIFSFANTQSGWIVMEISMLIGILFLIFGIMAKKKPFISLLIPLILLITAYLVNFIIEPITLLQGILWKIIFIGALVYSLMNIRESEKIQKESKYMASQDYK